jgi:hypothetical protein
MACRVRQHAGSLLTRLHRPEAPVTRQEPIPGLTVASTNQTTDSAVQPSFAVHRSICALLTTKDCVSLFICAPAPPILTAPSTRATRG